MAANSLYTLDDLATEVAQNYGDVSDITIAKAKKWINRALMRINEMGDWSWLMTFDATFTTVYDSGTATLINGATTKVVTLNATQLDAAYIVTASVNGNVAVTATASLQTTTQFTLTFSPAIPVSGAYELTWSIEKESYVLGEGVKKIYSIYYQQNVRRNLKLIEDRRFREIFTYNVTPSGTPVWYRLYGRDATTGRRKVALFPIPASQLPIYYDYRKEMPMLVNDSDDVRVVTGMPDHMIDALIELATAISFRQLDDSDYESAMAEAMARIQRLHAEDSTEIDDRIRMRNFDSAEYMGDPVLPPQYGDT